MEKDKWIEEVLNSTNGMLKVAPPDTLRDAIHVKISDRAGVPIRVILAAAVSLAILGFINFSIVRHLDVPVKSNPLQEVAFGRTNQLY